MEYFLDYRWDKDLLNNLWDMYVENTFHSISDESTDKYPLRSKNA